MNLHTGVIACSSAPLAHPCFPVITHCTYTSWNYMTALTLLKICFALKVYAVKTIHPFSHFIKDIALQFRPNFLCVFNVQNIIQYDM